MLDIRVQSTSPAVSVVMPIFNQEAGIASVLLSLAQSMLSPFELIVIDDASTDATSRQVESIRDSLVGNPRLCRFRLVRVPTSIFETACDVVGFELAEAPYLLEVQADMTVEDLGFDQRMLLALQSNPDVFMISGRGTSPLRPVADWYATTLGSVAGDAQSYGSYALSRSRQQIARFLPFRNSGAASSPCSRRVFTPAEASRIFPDAASFAETGEAGRIGELIETPLPAASIPRDRLWLGQTVMRGPLMIDRALYRSVGGLDVERFFLGFDDHDLAYRGYRDAGLRVAYLPVAFESPLCLGATRRPRSLAAELDMFRRLRRIRDVRSTSSLAGLARQEDPFLPCPEIRTLP